MTDELETRTIGEELANVPKAASGRPRKIIAPEGKNKSGKAATGLPGTSRSRYDAADDFSRSIDDCYRAVRERKANGGAGWP